MMHRMSVAFLLAGIAVFTEPAVFPEFGRTEAQQAQPQRQAAQARPAAGQQNRRGDPFGNFGGDSKDPIRVDADKLEVFDRDNKAIYSGDVIAVRGTTTMRSTQMTIFYDSSRRNQQGGQGNGGAVRSNTGGGAPQEGALKRIEFKGPVSVVNGTQTATANEMVYDAQAKTVTLKGNAVVADGPNIQRGELMVYNTEASIATITNPSCAQPPCRVQGVFTPGSTEEPKPKTR
jgi:lipopolysaccharide export system protein LptA